MMIAEKPDFKPLGRYSTMDVINILGIHRNTLRNYVKAGLILPLPKKMNRKENRYLGRDLNRLWNLMT